MKFFITFLLFGLVGCSAQGVSLGELVSMEGGFLGELKEEDASVRVVNTTSIAVDFYADEDGDQCVDVVFRGTVRAFGHDFSGPDYRTVCDVVITDDGTLHEVIVEINGFNLKAEGRFSEDWQELALSVGRIGDVDACATGEIVVFDE